MRATARIFNLLILVLAGAGALSTAFKSSSVPEFIGSTFGIALVLSPLWLSMLALGPSRPRIEKVALFSNKAFVFLLACGIVAIVFSLRDGGLGLAYLPLIILLFIASALNIAALNKQREQRVAMAPHAVVERDASQAERPSAQS